MTGSSTADQRSFRDLFGRLPRATCVITTGGPAGPGGMTASDICAVSLDPLLLLVCIRNSSATLRAIRGNQRFAVNVLTAEQYSLSERFAAALPPREKFASVDHREQDGSPVLAGVLGWLTCALHDVLPAGDHAIAVGRVLSVGDEPGAPLIWQPNASARQKVPQ